MKKIKIALALLVLILSSLACSVSNAENTPVAADEPATDAGQQPSSGSDKLQFASKDQVEVALGELRITDDGVFVFTVGSIRNKTNRPITGQIRIEYLDKDGNPIDVTVLSEEGAYDTTTFYAPIAPGETGYFDRMRDLSKLPVKPASARVSLEYAVLEKKSPLAKFSGTKWEVKNETLTFSGKVANSGDAACLSPYVVAVLMHAGKPVGTTTSTNDVEKLAPAASMDFSHSTITDFLPRFDDIKFVIECSSMSFER